MQTSEETFTVATYNVFDGRHPDKVINNILELIQGEASIICLQEIWLQYRNVNISKFIDANLPTHFQSQYFLGQSPNDYDYGLGILWNTDIFSTPTFHELSLPRKTHLTPWNKLFFWVLGLTPRIFKRGALIGTFTLGQKKFRITNLHLDFQGGDNHRANQLKSLTDYLTSKPSTDYEIICGDFNTLGLLNKQQKISTLEQRLGNELRSVLQKPYNSALVQQLDYIFIKNLTTHKAEVLKLSGSDHYPLIAEVGTL